MVIDKLLESILILTGYFSGVHIPARPGVFADMDFEPFLDRKSTRLNSSHVSISYAVFCLKKKKAVMDRDAIREKHVQEGPLAAVRQRQKVQRTVGIANRQAVRTGYGVGDKSAEAQQNALH